MHGRKQSIPSIWNGSTDPLTEGRFRVSRITMVSDADSYASCGYLHLWCHRYSQDGRRCIQRDVSMLMNNLRWRSVIQQRTEHYLTTRSVLDRIIGTCRFPFQDLPAHLMLYLVQNLEFFSPVCVARKGEYVRVFESQKEGSVRAVLRPTNVG